MGPIKNLDAFVEEHRTVVAFLVPFSCAARHVLLPRACVPIAAGIAVDAIVPPSRIDPDIEPSFRDAPLGVPN